MMTIGDYAVIGDGRSAALVSTAGTIDWLCWPRFDSPALLGAILDPRAGTWRIAPNGPFRIQRRYVDDTLVLRTRMVTTSGTAVLTDLMPVASEAEKHRRLVPEHEVLRIVECERGEVEIELLFEPRPDFGLAPVTFRSAGHLGTRLETHQGLFVFRSEAPLRIADRSIRAVVRLREGERFSSSLSLAADGPAVLPPLAEWSREALARSIRWWRDWCSKIHYRGPHRDAVVRSALVLKSMIYAPSGAVIAAPTTSLPERIGGDSNWDYRFCWLRDASLTARALLGLGCREEAEAFVSWLLHSTRLTQPRLEVLYDLFGRPARKEQVLDHLSGHRGSRPVRIGNAAANQLQLDLYGEVIDAASMLIRGGGKVDRDTAALLFALAKHVGRNWMLPDEGIWEPRWGRAKNTHSRLLCWTALDRVIDLQQKGLLPQRAGDDLAANREAIRTELQRSAWNEELQSYVARVGEPALDATLFLLPWYGFEDAASPRMQSTYRRLQAELGAGDGLYHRNRDKFLAGEGAFGICGFWAAEFLALGGGSISAAQQSLDRLCRYANDVGLFAEQIDPTTGEALGNFPQAFTHVGLINTALTLARRIEREAPRHGRTVKDELERVAPVGLR